MEIVNCFPQFFTFFLSDHPANDCTVEVLPAVCLDAFLVQLLGNDVAGIPLQEQLEDPPDDLRLIFFDGKLAANRPVTVNLASPGLPFLIPFSDAPFTVFRDTAAFLLCESR